MVVLRPDSTYITIPTDPFERIDYTLHTSPILQTKIKEHQKEISSRHSTQVTLLLRWIRHPWMHKVQTTNQVILPTYQLS